MKKTINGIRYNTEKATEIGHYQSEHYHGDFARWNATLYKSPRSGRFFLAGEGGPMSRYSTPMGQNSWSGGEKIEPMTEEEAFAWAQEYLDEEAIEKHFGHLVEDA